jgi:xanthine dehydrogenase/oxidase
MVADTTEFQAGGTWFKPTSLREMLALMQEFEVYKIVVGNTEVGIETRFKHAVYPRLICPADTIRELFDFEVTKSAVFIGSCCPLSKIQHECFVSAEADPSLARSLMPIHDMLRWFASGQIRNVACLGGNLVTASPISDMNPMMAAMGGKLIISSVDVGGELQQRKLNVSSFFLKYRTVDLKHGELIERIELPILSNMFEYFKPFKQARRREDDISIVTSGMRLRLGIVDGKFMIEDVAIAFGGMAPTTLMATKTCATLMGKELNVATFEKASEMLLEEFALPVGVPGGQAAYRMTLAASFLYQFYLHVIKELSIDIKTIKENPTMFPEICKSLPDVPLVDEYESSGTFNFLSEKKPNYSGVQRYPAPRVAKGLEDVRFPLAYEPPPAQAVVVGKASSHMSGPLHCTGEALYTDDIPLPPGTLHAILVLSTECGGIFESMDVSDTLKIPGVVDVYSYADILKLGGDNKLGPIVYDELVFVPPGEKIRAIGQVLGVVVAESLHCAELGARSIKVKYGPSEGKVIVTVEDAIEAGSFYDFSRHILERGDTSVLSDLTSSTDFQGIPKIGDVVKISGSCYTGPQEHFYLETQTTLVVPSESDTNLTIYSSTQAPTKTQKFCASATGTPAAKVVCRMKRMGGGFGGKETRSVFVAAAAAVAAKRSCRPVRLSLSRDVDMKTSGTRHAFVSKYHASAQITEDGAKLLAFDAKLFGNAGFAFDLSGPIIDRALFHVDGCYYFPNFRAEGVACKTSQPAHTAYRGFGAPQGMAIVEQVMDHLALACNVSGDVLRRMNMYKNGDHLPFGMIMGETTSGKWNVPAMWDRLHRELDVPSRRHSINEFNAKNKWTKRGLALIPTKFGIAYTAKFMVCNYVFISTILTDLLLTHHFSYRIKVVHLFMCIQMELFSSHMEEQKWGKVFTQRFVRLQRRHLVFLWMMFTLTIPVPTK